jgi:hypothetical protein
MRLSYARPALTNVISGTGAAFISPTDGSALVNGRPADVQRIRWMTASPLPPAITDFVTITGTFGAATKVGCCALLLPNLSTAIPAGVKITFSGLLSATPVALGGNAITTRTQLLPNGATAIWCVFPAVTIDTLIVKIYNDTNSSGSPATWAIDSQFVDLGELWVGKTADFKVANDVKTEWRSGILQRRSHNNQAWALEQQAFRETVVQLVPMAESIAIGPNSAQDDYETVAYAISTSDCCVMIPSYLVRGVAVENGSPPSVINATTISVQRLHRTAMLGVVGGEGGQAIDLHVNGDKYYVSPIVFGETPP